MSKSSGTAATSLRQVAATLHSLAYPAALATGGPGAAELRLLSVNGAFMEATGRDAAALAGHGLAELREAKLCPRPGDRKSVVSGKSVSVRVDLGGRRIIKKNKNKHTTNSKSTAKT